MLETETGEIDETGDGDGRGCNFNIPLPYGSGDQAYAKAMDELVAPVVRDFGPDLIVVACGQVSSLSERNDRTSQYGS